MKNKILVIFFIGCLTACMPATPSPEIIQTAIAETNAAAPTNTSTVTNTETLTPTATLKPSYTPTIQKGEFVIDSIWVESITPDIFSILASVYPTRTPEPTNTITITNTVEKTVSPLQLTKQERSIISTQTAEELSIARTATKEVLIAYATETSKKSNITRQELINYPNNHIGELVKLPWARVFNVKAEDKVLQVFYAGTTDAIYVVFRDPFTKVYEDTSITIYGYISGEECFVNTYNATICQPKLEDAFFGINE